MSAARERKNASRNLGMALQVAYRRMIEAEGKDDIQFAAIELGQLFNTNIEFVVWVLKEYGGVKQMPAERLFKAAPKPVAANDAPLPVLSSEITGIPAAEPCTCPPLEPGIIGRDKHMTSCSLFVP